MLIALPLVSLLLSSAGAPVRYPGLDALIDKLAASFDQQVERTTKDARTVRVRKEELDGDGKVEHVEEELLRAVGEGEARELRLVQATEDGKDVTAERLAKRQHGHPNDRDGKSHGMEEANPFAKARQGQYRYWVVGPVPSDGAPIRVHFEPNGDRTAKLITGDALVDPASGAIRELAFSPSSLPPLVDGLTVRAVLGGEGAASAATELEVDGGGHFLFWHKHFRVHLWFGYSPEKT